MLYARINGTKLTQQDIIYWQRYKPSCSITCVIEVIRMQHAIQIYTQVRAAHFYVKFMGEPQ